MIDGLAVLGTIFALAIAFTAGASLGYFYLSKFDSWKELKHDLFN